MKLLHPPIAALNWASTTNAVTSLSTSAAVDADSNSGPVDLGEIGNK
jgi:hypothetical protein